MSDCYARRWHVSNFRNLKQIPQIVVWGLAFYFVSFWVTLLFISCDLNLVNDGRWKHGDYGIARGVNVESMYKWKLFFAVCTEFCAMEFFSYYIQRTYNVLNADTSDLSIDWLQIKMFMYETNTCHMATLRGEVFSVHCSVSLMIWKLNDDDDVRFDRVLLSIHLSLNHISHFFLGGLSCVCSICILYIWDCIVTM